MFFRMRSQFFELSLSAFVFYFCIFVSIIIAPTSHFQNIFWPVAGVSLAILLLKGYKHALSLLLALVFHYLPQTSISPLPSSYGLIAFAVLLPVFQSLLGLLLVSKFLGSDLWVFSNAKKLMLLISMGGIIPSVFSAFAILVYLGLFELNWPGSHVDFAVSTFLGNACSVAILTPFILMFLLKNSAINFNRKIRIIIPIIGVFGVAAVCFGALYYQLRSQLEAELQQRLVHNRIALEQRVNHIYERLQMLQSLLSEDKDLLKGNFDKYAKMLEVSHSNAAYSPPYFAVGLFSYTSSNSDIGDHYELQTIYPEGEFSSVKKIPFDGGDASMRSLSLAVSRGEILTLPNFDGVNSVGNPNAVILIRSLYSAGPHYLLAALVSVSNLALQVEVQYGEHFHGFQIEDVQSGRVIYPFSGGHLFASEHTTEYQQRLTMGDRVWRLITIYDNALLDQALYENLFYISVTLLLIITFFTVFILNALVSMQSLEIAVNASSKELEEERRFLSAIFDGLPLFVFVKDVHTHAYLRVNRYTECITGVAAEQYIGKTAYDLFDESEASERTASDIRAMHNDGPLTVGEESISTPSGMRYLFTRKTIIRDSRGAPKYVLGIAEDVTLRKNQKLTLDSLVEALPTALLVVDELGVVDYANHSVKQLLDIEVLKTTVKDVLPDCDFNMIVGMLNNASENARPIIVVAKVCSKQDFWLPVEVTIKRTVWNDNQRYLVLIADISDRVSAQKSLRDSENQLRLLMANLGEGVCGIDPLGNVTYANLAAYDLLGYETGGLANINFYQSIFLPDNDGGDPIFRACSLGQITRSLFAKFICKDGEVIPVEYVCTPLISEDDRNLGAVVVFSNIQERMEYQSNLERRNELIALGVDASGLGSWEWHSVDNYVHWSSNLYQILDMPEDAFSGDPNDVKKIIHPQDIKELKIVDEYAKQHLEVTDFCCRLIRHDGQVIWVTGKYRYFTDSCGEIVRARGILWDSTDETLLQRDNFEKAEALRRSNKELDDFAHIASHDLKEPLRGIANYTTFLQEDYFDQLDSNGKAMLKSIYRLTQHMERLISDLLNYSRLGRTELAFVEVDIDLLITQVVESLLPRLQELDVGVCYVSPMPVLYCDGVRIREVFRNFISNAMKYNCSSNKLIELGCEVTNDEVIFSIADNGIGIAPEFQAKIFDVFKRLHGNNEYGGGSGIGLSIVQKVIAQHHGRLWLESEAGRGSKFYFAIPVVSKKR